MAKGKKNKINADNCAEHAVFMAALISIVLSSTGLLFGREILSLFGAEGEILNLGWEYLNVMCIGMPFMIFSGFFRSNTVPPEEIISAVIVSNEPKLYLLVIIRHLLP